MRSINDCYLHIADNDPQLSYVKFARDIEALSDHLRIRKFSVVCNNACVYVCNEFKFFLLFCVLCRATSSTPVTASAALNKTSLNRGIAAIFLCVSLIDYHLYPFSLSDGFLLFIRVCVLSLDTCVIGNKQATSDLSPFVLCRLDLARARPSQLHARRGMS